MSGLRRDRLAVLEVSAPEVIVTTLTVMARLGRDVETRLDQDGKPTRTPTTTELDLGQTSLTARSGRVRRIYRTQSGSTLARSSWSPLRRRITPELA
jgi:hypothetical protein